MGLENKTNTPQGQNNGYSIGFYFFQKTSGICRFKKENKIERKDVANTRTNVQK
jgi:hypothetical protein